MPGVRYKIELRYCEWAGGANVGLQWSSATQAKQVIPQSLLYTLASVTAASAAGASGSAASGGARKAAARALVRPGFSPPRPLPSRRRLPARPEAAGSPTR